MSEQMDADEAWRLIVEAIPTKHLRRPCQRGRVFGFRRGLAAFAAGRRALRYLEVGTRLGHSLALVCLVAGDELAIATAVDLWVRRYGGEPNPGADEVLERLRGLGVGDSQLELLSGDSHTILPNLKGREYDLVLIDGDHTELGARQDLEQGFELLAPGGSLVFDDCDNGPEGNLREVWLDVMRGRDCEVEFASVGVCAEGAGVPAWAWAVRGPRA